MMEAATIINELEKHGVTLTLTNQNKIKPSFPGARPPEQAMPLLEQAKQNRQLILEHLLNLARATGEQVPLNSPQPAAGAGEDPFMLRFQKTMKALCASAGVQDDTFTIWLEQHRPKLAGQIARSETRLNELWGNDMGQFKAELRNYQALSAQAIRRFRTIRKETGK